MREPDLLPESEPAPPARPEPRPAPPGPPEPAATSAPVVADLGSLGEYLADATDPWEADQVLGPWKAAVRRAAAARDAAAVRWLADLLRDAEPADDDVRLVVTSALDAALDVETVRGLLPDVPSEPLDGTVELLAPLGAHVIPVAFTALTEEERRGRRAQLVSLLAELAGDHVERLATWLDDERWFVVRNALTVLRRLDADEALPFVERALAHQHPRVRLEAVRALVEFGGARSADHLLTMLRDADADVRSVALRGLAGAGDRRLVDVLGDPTVPKDARREIAEVAVRLGPEARERLRALLRGPEIPRGVRRHLQTLLGGAPPEETPAN